MADEVGNQEPARLPDTRPENPYGENYYNAARYNGQRFVDWLLNASTQKLNPQQVEQVLTSIYQNFAYDPARRTILAEEPNFVGADPEFGSVNDWIIEVVANAQDYLATKTGVKPPLGGNDARTSRSRPIVKYKPSIK